MVRWRVLAVTTITAANNGVNSLVLGLSGVLPSISPMNHHSKCMRKALTLSLWGWEFTDLLKVTWLEWWPLCLLRWAGPRLCWPTALQRRTRSCNAQPGKGEQGDDHLRRASVAPAKSHPWLIQSRILPFVKWLVSTLKGTRLRNNKSNNSKWDHAVFFFSSKQTTSPSSQDYGFSSSHVWMWELDHKEKLSAKELVLLNCGVGEDSWEPLGLQGDPTSPSWRKLVLGVHWKDWCWSWSSNTLPPDVKSWLIWKDPDAGKDWGQEKKGVTEDEMVGWHHWLNGHESE